MMRAAGSLLYDQLVCDQGRELTWWVRTAESESVLAGRQFYKRPIPIRRKFTVGSRWNTKNVAIDRRES